MAKYATITLFLIWAICPILSFAAELKILDQYGLTRALKSVGETGTVLVTVVAKDGKLSGLTLSLTSVDGIGSDISGQSEGEGRFVFSQIRGGTWRVRPSSPDIEIAEVKILK